ncbi:anaphase-promoting complex subunit 5-like [Homarus americanus]|uniref:anaphase-promoting complex subunit 5-like n=1 Tax=Homarus americanus TaxID=6706 RepID=UPI001C443EBD|nr:anaphase-promoting complex subunit 5-like [Homarus americanus]XP_042236489.1 anaphase-promoting complex subunit 5-like [Homarus americanus]XP_042236490.1 anaphase-promoting complex subunit 5-like [Homarus americanus]
MIGQSVAPLYGGSNRRERDVVTPHNISILLFIEKYARLRPKYWEHRPSDSSISHPDITPQERKATCLMTVRLVQGGDMVLSELLQVLESAPLLPHHITSFMTALHQMYCSGIDSLLNLFDSVEKFAIQDQPRTETFPCLWTSVVGLYLRRLNLSFRRLSFSQVTSLYQRFRHYYEECYASHSSHLQQSADIQMTAEESNIADDTDSDAKMEDMMEETREDDNGTDLTLCSAEVMAINSSDVGESSVQPPLLLLPQTHPRDMEPTSSQAGHSTRQQAELFISQQTSLLQFSETAALSPPDLQEKIRQLVRQNPDLAEAHYLSYLNCVRVKEFSGAVHSLLRTYDGHLMQRDSGRMEDQGRGFRYAALNLAALHAQFGHKKAGLAVLKEAIRLAQESSDHVCLQHALAWLYTLSPTHKAQLMRRSMVKSCELSLSYLRSLGRLNHAAQLAHTRATPAYLLQSIVRAEALNCQHSLVSLQHGAWALRAALWANWGVSTMTSLASQLLLHLNTHHPTNPTTFYSAQPTCAAICNIAMGLANLGEYQLAGEVLQHAQERFPAHGQHSHTWMFAHAHITLTDLLHQGRWTEAQIVITNMATSHPTEAKLRQCELLVAKGELTEAWELLGELQKDPEVVGELRVRLLLVESCAAVAGGGNAVAVPLLVEGITTAHEHHLTYLAALTHLHLANVQLQLGLHKEAEVSVAGGLGVILAGGSVYDQARARLVAAKLQVSKAKGKDRIGKLLETAVSLELVRKLFMKVRAYQKVRETLYFKARLYHEVGYIEERNKCALEFRQFELQQPCQSYQLSINSF